MSEPSHYQNDLLREFASTSSFGPLSPAFMRAFMETPRHKFIHRYRIPSESEWSTFDMTDHHLRRVYRDEPLTISGDGAYTFSSSSSQPSFVLGLAELLDLKSGDRVLEIGSGSGWLLSILAAVVSESGRAVGLEIIDDLARQSVSDIAALGLNHAEVFSADANAWKNTGDAFDAVISTAGVYAVPRNIIDNCRMGAKLVIPVQIAGTGTIVFLFEKTEEGLKSVSALDAYFVPLQNQNGIQSVRSLDDWLSHNPGEPRRIAPFWWGNYLPKLDFINKSGPFRAFLTITRLDRLKTFDLSGSFNREGFSFGFAEPGSASLVTRNGIEHYGSAQCELMMQAALEEWFALGMPVGASYSLQIGPSATGAGAERSWSQKRGDEIYRWSLQVSS